MKKLLTTLVVLGLLGGGGYWLYTRVLMTPEKRLCSKMGQLCGAETAKRCEQNMVKLRERAGDEALASAEACVDRADTCLNVTGCLVGANLRGLGGFLKGVVDGLGTGLEAKGKQLLDKLDKKLAPESE